MTEQEIITAFENLALLLYTKIHNRDIVFKDARDKAERRNATICFLYRLHQKGKLTTEELINIIEALSKSKLSEYHRSVCENAVQAMRQAIVADEADTISFESVKHLSWVEQSWQPTEPKTKKSGAA